MSIGIVLLTHERVGQVLLDAAKAILGEPAVPVRLVDVPHTITLERATAQSWAAVDSLGAQSQVLVMVDLFGATPSNIGVKIIEALPGRTAGPSSGALVSGLSLSMLLRVLNSPNRPLAELVQRACEGAKEGVVCVESP